MKVIPNSQIHRWAGAPARSWYGIGGNTPVPSGWFKQADKFNQVFVGIIASESGGFLTSSDTYIILPNLIENLDTPFYARLPCADCKCNTPHRYYKYDIGIEDWCVRQFQHGHLDHPPPDLNMVRKTGRWCYCHVSADLIRHQMISDPRPVFHQNQCLICLNDPRVGALTLINPLQGALTYHEGGGGLLSILT